MYQEEAKLWVTTVNPGRSLTPLYVLTTAVYTGCLTVKLWLFLTRFYSTFGFYSSPLSYCFEKGFLDGTICLSPVTAQSYAVVRICPRIAEYSIPFRF